MGEGGDLVVDLAEPVGGVFGKPGVGAKGGEGVRHLV
jgi:hypothetical protein